MIRRDPVDKVFRAALIALFIGVVVSTINAVVLWAGLYQRKQTIIKGYHGKTLLFISYENPVIMRHGPVDGIDRIEIETACGN